MSYLKKEVNCTDRYPSVSIPCLGASSGSGEEERTKSEAWEHSYHQPLTKKLLRQSLSLPPTLHPSLALSLAPAHSYSGINTNTLAPFLSLCLRMISLRHQSSLCLKLTLTLALTPSPLSLALTLTLILGLSLPRYVNLSLSLSLSLWLLVSFSHTFCLFLVHKSTYISVRHFKLWLQ